MARPVFTLGIEEEFQTIDPVTRDLRSHMSKIVEDGRITLRMPQDWAALASDRLLNRVRGLGRVVGLDGRIEIGGN